ncbi:hypothetical protein DMP23_27600 [Amycolatopsis sp. A1MSW2902]|uniref:hypothetical protein n=1 Tax=Amycolatopsis sp. A1MSW2902 TaxID=687413 RepID=UPI00039BC616
MTDNRGAAGAGSYSLDAAGLDRVADEFEKLANEFTTAVGNARVIAQMLAPALDYASGNNAETFRNSGGVLITSLQDRAQYCRQQAAKFRAATGKYQTVEAEQAHDVKKVGGTL